MSEQSESAIECPEFFCHDIYPDRDALVGHLKMDHNLSERTAESTAKQAVQSDTE